MDAARPAQSVILAVDRKMKLHLQKVGEVWSQQTEKKETRESRIEMSVIGR